MLSDHQGDAGPAAPGSGRRARYDYEYERNGTANLFIGFATRERVPEACRRYVDATERRTEVGFAAQMKALSDERYPEADTMRVVLHQLNTHRPASLYEAYEPAEARRIPRRLEFHYTPKYASRLNQAEIEFSVLSEQCLDRRIGDKKALEAEIAAWQAERNGAGATAEWRFRNEDARAKRHRLYLARP